MLIFDLFVCVCVYDAVVQSLGRLVARSFGLPFLLCAPWIWEAEPRHFQAAAAGRVQAYLSSHACPCILSRRLAQARSAAHFDTFARQGTRDSYRSAFSFELRVDATDRVFKRRSPRLRKAGRVKTVRDPTNKYLAKVDVLMSGRRRLIYGVVWSLLG